MDKPAPPIGMGLDPAGQRWARRLAQTQAARDELVRLLGLLRILGGIATGSDSLRDGAQAITRHLVNYLGLEYCGFYVRLDGAEALTASHGQPPSPAIAALMEDKIRAGATFSGWLGQEHGQGQLACLPLLGTSERLGGLAMVLGQGLAPRQRRHLAMVAEAVAPVLENFILRGRLQEFNHSLRQESRRNALTLAELDQAHQETEACLSGLMSHDPEPLFIMDGRGRLVRCNPALEGLLGWSRDHLLGRSLAEFFAQPQDWEQISRSLEQGLPAVDRQLPLVVQCGTRVPARLCLRRFFRSGQAAGTLGRLHRVEAAGHLEGGVLTPQELEELASRCGEVGNQVNNLLAALRAHLQLALLQDLTPPLRQRLEVLELLAEDSKGVTRQVRQLVEHLGQRRRQVAAQAQLWPSPEGPDRGGHG
ncbi:MAG: PAS domain-containing protein [Desulfarculus sp.]|nr:PAS domain-containing protein [Desulfarculus sp.]